jgi:hypothetical protein
MADAGLVWGMLGDVSNASGFIFNVRCLARSLQLGSGYAPQKSCAHKQRAAGYEEATTAPLCLADDNGELQLRTVVAQQDNQAQGTDATRESTIVYISGRRFP